MCLSSNWHILKAQRQPLLLSKLGADMFKIKNINKWNGDEYKTNFLPKTEMFYFQQEVSAILNQWWLCSVSATSAIVGIYKSEWAKSE